MLQWETCQTVVQHDRNILHWREVSEGLLPGLALGIEGLERSFTTLYSTENCIMRLFQSVPVPVRKHHRIL